MIPTPRAVLAMAIGVPTAMAAGLAAEPLWIVGPAWIAAVLLLLAIDAAACRRPAAFTLALDVPGTIEVGRPAPARFRFQGRPPPAIDLAPEADPRLDVDPPTLHGPGTAPFAFTLKPGRRGTATLRRLHLRWSGPLGLVRRIQARPLDHPIAVVPQISRVRAEALRLFSRSRSAGAAQVQDFSGSTEFHALREFSSGDERRLVSWRQSARHAKLLVRETEAERNRVITLAIDTGRLMSEPLAAGLPRLDHALNAALMLAYVCLRMNDRVALFAFDAEPVLASGAVSGPAAFGPLQRLAATLDYSTAETNFTLGLTNLATGLSPGGLAVVFTDFADPTGAELMIENVGRLLERHRVLFVAFRDDPLQALAAAPPETEDAVARAVVAGTLLAERQTVLARLRHLGAEILEGPAVAAGPALVARYLALKQRGRV